MVIILKGSELHKQPELFEKIFRLRHEVFIDGRGWSLPAKQGLEIDQYDNDDAVYFIDVGDDGSIHANIRITPTDKWSLLADYFPHLVETGEPPRSPDIYECTRYIVQPFRKTGENSKVLKSRIISALIEWGIEHKLSALQTVIEAPTLSSYIELTAQTVPMGLAHPYGGGKGTHGGGECMAITWPVTTQVLEDIRASGQPSVSQARPPEVVQTPPVPVLEPLH